MFVTLMDLRKIEQYMHKPNGFSLSCYRIRILRHHA